MADIKFEIKETLGAIAESGRVKEKVNKNHLKTIGYFTGKIRSSGQIVVSKGCPCGIICVLSFYNTGR